jgi:hypothetical protein
MNQKNKREKFSAKVVYVNELGTEVLIEQTFYPYMIFRLVGTKSIIDFQKKQKEHISDCHKIFYKDGRCDFFLVHSGYSEHYDQIVSNEEFNALISKAGKEAVEWWCKSRKDFMKKLDEKSQIRNLKKAMREEFGNDIFFQDMEGPDFIAEIESTKERIGIEVTKCVPYREKMSVDTHFEKLKREFRDNDYLVNISKEQKWMIIIDTTREVYNKHKPAEYCEQFEIQLRQAYEKKEPVRGLSLIERVRISPTNGSNCINFNPTSGRYAVTTKDLIKSIDEKEVKLDTYELKDNCWLCINLPCEQSLHSYRIVADEQCSKETFIERINRSGYKRIYITSFGPNDITPIKPCDRLDEIITEELL